MIQEWGGPAGPPFRFGYPAGAVQPGQAERTVPEKVSFGHPWGQPQQRAVKPLILRHDPARACGRTTGKGAAQKKTGPVRASPVNGVVALLGRLSRHHYGLAFVSLAADAHNDIAVRSMTFKDALDRNAAPDRDRANHVQISSSTGFQDCHRIVKS
jgi:hypothetical protein